jgi:hypothetical protein
MFVLLVAIAATQDGALVHQLFGQRMPAPSGSSAPTAIESIVPDQRYDLDPFLPSPGGRAMFISPLWIPKQNYFVSFARLDLFPANHRTHLYVRKHDSHLIEIEGSARSMPWPHGCQLMEDPRAILIGDMLVVVWGGRSEAHGNRWMIWAQGVDSVTLDVTTSAVPIVIAGAKSIARVEKNWAPFELSGTLHFVYTFDPLIILECGSLFSNRPPAGQCNIAYSQSVSPLSSAPTEVPVATASHMLRGGTNMIPVDASEEVCRTICFYPNYLAFAFAILLILLLLPCYLSFYPLPSPPPTLPPGWV